MPLSSRDMFTTISQICFDHGRCFGCGLCEASCPVEGLVVFDEEHNPRILDDRKCTRCESCVHACPLRAVRLVTVRDPTMYDFEKPRFLAPGQRSGAYTPNPPSSSASSSSSWSSGIVS